MRIRLSGFSRIDYRHILLAAFVLTLAADLASKIAAWQLLEESPVPLLGDFQLRVLYNAEAPFGLGGSLIGNAALIAAAVAVVVMVSWAWRARRRESLVIGIMAGGAAGNLIDRLFGGSVLDWIDPGFGGVFNLADLAILGGLAVFVSGYIDDDSNTERSDGHVSGSR